MWNGCDLLIPQIGGAINDQIKVTPFPSNTYQLTDTQIVGSIDGLTAIQQAVYHILSTERYAYVIYDENHGVELEKYKGRSFGYLETTIQNTLRDALLQDDRILAVNVTDVVKQAIDSTLVKFDVISDRGTFNAEVNVHV